ncbi:hypothetical protein [Deinococcus sp. QL22]|uniref:hypothetical protein n=1 Tax=Deinococcus sp. QL22 TaxID=2939437 RepID=UPI002016F1DA|nr:hypothetical protein [Deinococcus sp. QL22]
MIKEQVERLVEGVSGDAVQWTVLGLLVSTVLLSVTLLYRADRKKQKRRSFRPSARPSAGFYSIW